MVIYDIERDAELFTVASVCEPPKSRWATIRILHGKWKDAVVPPVSLARELCDGHQLNGRDPQILQAMKPRNYRIKRTLRREGPDVNLIEDKVPA
jgi:hypothetical protein